MGKGGKGASTKSGNGWLLITAGAGDIDTLVQPIKADH